MRIWRYITMFAICALVAGCNVTRKLPAEQYLLNDNRVVVEKDEELKRTEKITSDELSQYIKQRANKHLLGTDFYIWMYQRAKPNKTNWANRWLRKMGEAPVIYDSMQTLKSVDGMSIYLRGSGFFNSDVDFVADTIKRRINVKYIVREGQPYRINSISYVYQDKFLEPILAPDTVNSLVKAGSIYNTDLLQKERERITNFLRSGGYYTFNITNVSYVADTTAGNRNIALKVLIKQRLGGYDAEDKPQYENSSIFRIKNIYVYSDYNPTKAVEDPSYYSGLDTMEYRGIYFLYRKSLNIKPEVLLRAVNIFPNSLYDATSVRKAYDNLMKLNYFKNTNIFFTELKDTTDNLVTFIGDDASTADNLTREGHLNCNILCTPGDKQGYNIDIEGTTSNNYYGMILTAGYQNKNIFKGVELLEFNVRGGYEFMRIKGKSNSLELGSSLALTFPRFMSPIKIDRYNRLNNVKTKIEVSINSQNRPYYNRVLSAGAFGYTWTNNKFSSYVVKPIDISLIKLNSIESSFYDSIVNPYLKESYKSQLIAGISGSYIYNNQLSGVNKNTFRIRVNGETNGNFISLLTKVFSKPTSSGYNELFGIRFAQYARIDADASYKFVLGQKTALVYRLYGGFAHPYGNSVAIPFERQFYCGGPNGMRGWTARTLGPGSSQVKEDEAYPQQTGNLKLETNLEFRFPIYEIIHGAVFADVGNVWWVGDAADTPESRFKLNNFYKQLGFDGGFGIRLDFSFFVLRVDWGLKLHDPNRAQGFRWIKTMTLRQSSFNFGIGYPF